MRLLTKLLLRGMFLATRAKPLRGYWERICMQIVVLAEIRSDPLPRKLLKGLSPLFHKTAEDGFQLWDGSVLTLDGIADRMQRQLSDDLSHHYGKDWGNTIPGLQKVVDRTARNTRDLAATYHIKARLVDIQLDALTPQEAEA